MLDITTRLVPFLNHNDAVKVQMASVQARQSIPLINGQVPYIRTGFEEQYLQYSSYLYIAKDNGQVIYKDEILMIVKYDNGGGEVIKLGGPYCNRENFDKILYTKYNIDDKFKKGDILTYHSSINENGFLMLGTNLKTTYISCPETYKDALVISESCAQKMSTRIIHDESIECIDTIPILWNNNNISYPQGTYVNKAQPIFIIKQRNPNNPIDIISSGQEILAPVNGKLYYKIIVDEIVKTQNEEDYYSDIYKEEITREELISQKIYEIYNMNNFKESLEANAFVNYYCPQLHKHRSGKSIILHYWIVSECPLMIGCKLSNRHGNKGVISKIFADKDMPTDKYGEHADIVVSSMCVTSRKNTGQLFELHINRANYLYTNKIINDENIDNNEKINKLYDMVSIVQPSYINKIFKDTINNMSNSQKEDFINDIKRNNNIIQMVQPPFTDFTYNDCLNFCKRFGDMDDSLKEPLIFRGENINASFGHIYWYRLQHEPYLKYFSRSVGSYGKIGQPARNNGTNKSAHRMGEMEVWSLMGHQSYENILELFVPKSDNISESGRLLKACYDGELERYTPFSTTPNILNVLKTFCNAAGYSIDDEDDIEYNNNDNNKDNNIDNIFNMEKEMEFIEQVNK